MRIQTDLRIEKGFVTLLLLPLTATGFLRRAVTTGLSDDIAGRLVAWCGIAFGSAAWS